MPVNTREEIDVLALLFPNVKFFAATRDARDQYDKPYIFFDDILACLYNQGVPICGIVNSDIHLLAPGLYEFVKQQAAGAFLFGARIDVDSLERRHLGQWYRGFDYFFSDREIIPHEEFCIGLPWWDYWAALIPMLNGIPVKKNHLPVAYQTRHTPGNLTIGSWVPLGLIYAKYFHVRCRYADPARQWAITKGCTNGCS